MKTDYFDYIATLALVHTFLAGIVYCIAIALIIYSYWTQKEKIIRTVENIRDIIPKVGQTVATRNRLPAISEIKSDKSIREERKKKHRKSQEETKSKIRKMRVHSDATVRRKLKDGLPYEELSVHDRIPKHAIEDSHSVSSSEGSTSSEIELKVTTSVSKISKSSRSFGDGKYSKKAKYEPAMAGRKKKQKPKKRRREKVTISKESSTISLATPLKGLGIKLSKKFGRSWLANKEKRSEIRQKDNYEWVIGTSSSKPKARNKGHDLVKHPLDPFYATYYGMQSEKVFSDNFPRRHRSPRYSFAVPDGHLYGNRSELKSGYGVFGRRDKEPSWKHEYSETGMPEYVKERIRRGGLPDRLDPVYDTFANIHSDVFKGPRPPKRSLAYPTKIQVVDGDDPVSSGTFAEKSQIGKLESFAYPTVIQGRSQPEKESKSLEKPSESYSSTEEQKE